MSSEGFTQDEHDACIAEAKATGKTIIRGNFRQLLLDLDIPYSWAQFLRVKTVVFRYFEPVKIEHWDSQGGNKHVLITLAKPLGFLERTLIQAALGSDGVKEFLTLLRHENGIVEPALLFRPANAKVQELK